MHVVQILKVFKSRLKEEGHHVIAHQSFLQTTTLDLTTKLIYGPWGVSCTNLRFGEGPLKTTMRYLSTKSREILPLSYSMTLSVTTTKIRSRKILLPCFNWILHCVPPPCSNWISPPIIFTALYRKPIRYMKPVVIFMKHRQTVIQSEARANGRMVEQKPIHYRFRK